jgi:hypothetical protein
MDDKTRKERHKFINTICNPTFRPFIDINKLCKSQTYRLAVEAAADHASMHGNFTLLNNLFSLLDGTQHANSLIALLRPKLNFIVTETTPRMLKKAGPWLAAQDAAEEALGLKKIPPKLTIPIPVKRLGLEREARSNDLMDSGLMLPGSYGTGRRR